MNTVVLNVVLLCHLDPIHSPTIIVRPEAAMDLVTNQPTAGTIQVCVCEPCGPVLETLCIPSSLH
jgi:hypothetical protein